MLSFEWDEGKNKANQKKHGVSIEEASTVFLDERAILFDESRPFREGGTVFASRYECCSKGEYCVSLLQGIRYCY